MVPLAQTQREIEAHALLVAACPHLGSRFSEGQRAPECISGNSERCVSLASSAWLLAPEPRLQAKFQFKAGEGRARQLSPPPEEGEYR